MFNVHAWGGREMMKEAVQAASTGYIGFSGDSFN